VTLHFKLMVFERQPATQDEAKRLPNSVMMAVPTDADEFRAMTEARNLIGPSRLVTIVDVFGSARQGAELEMYRPFVG
jgi:hypothetical protein